MNGVGVHNTGITLEPWKLRTTFTGWFKAQIHDAGEQNEWFYLFTLHTPTVIAVFGGWTATLEAMS